MGFGCVLMGSTEGKTTIVIVNDADATVETSSKQSPLLPILILKNEQV